MANLSLQASVRTCKMDTGYAANIESDRFLNPNQVVCPVWNGRDLAGRQVCADSFFTKRAGCNSASDRVDVENFLRPSYTEYITLDAAGFRANQFDTSNMYTAQSMDRTKDLANLQNVTGNYGKQFGASVQVPCGAYPKNRAMAQEAAEGRANQAMQEGYKAHYNRRMSGF